MSDKELKKLAVYVVDELLSRQQKLDEGYIYMDEICKLTGLSEASIYRHRQLKMPVVRHGGRLCSKRTELMEWINNR